MTEATVDVRRAWDDGLLRRLSPRIMLVGALLVVAATLLVSGWLGLSHRILSGPGDELEYYAQAERLLPFTHHYYGPSYFATLRLLHEVTGLGWFAAGRVISWVSAVVVLVLSLSLFRRVLPAAAAVAALLLVALSPEFITHSYSSLTFMFGTAWVLAAVVLLQRAVPERLSGWALAGSVMGLAALGRFQSFGFLLGALAFVPFVRASWSRRALIGLVLLVTAILPLIVWLVFLRVVQGGAPANYNFVHLTLALGEFQSFAEVPVLIAKYGSMVGVLKADPLNFVRIVLYGVKEALRFPLIGGPQLIALGAGLLVPGAVLVALRRASYAPWMGALVSGYVLTGIGWRGWAFYYVALLPLFAVLVAVAIEAMADGHERRVPAWWLLWGAVLLSTTGLALSRVPRNFDDLDWAEWRVAKEYLARRAGPTTVVTSSASSIAYEAPFRFVDQNGIVSRRDSASYVATLRAAGVHYLVVSERHSLYEYPWLSPLLQDSAPPLPAGVVRDTLIRFPRRLAIVRIVHPNGS